jgi:exodeoxyribonuclease V gamma subunit
VPHRVVCLLGLDDAVFPRKAPRDGDDLRLDDPHVGERDPRAEDRQLLLDALMAAQERLIVTYTGNDERTNAGRPPAVPVGELLDMVDRTVRTDDGGRPRDRVLVQHPLQPFDPRNFTPGRITAGGPWSFDAVVLDGARALTAARPEPPRFLPDPLPRAGERVVELDDLVRFVAHPVRAFLRGRLGLSLGDFTTDLEDALPVQLDALEEWAIGQRLLDARLEGCDAQAAYRAEIARGHLPPRYLGKPVIERLLPAVEAIFAAAEELVGGEPSTSADVRLTLPDGRALSGSIAGLRGDALQAVTFSRVAPKHRLQAWVRLLALDAAGHEARAATVGKAREGDGITVATIEPLAREDALHELQALADLHDRALCEPLPMACRTSAAYAIARSRGGDGLRPASSEWSSTDWRAKEDAETEHVLAFGGIRSFADLRGEPPRDDERGPGWDLAEQSRFGRLAMRLWAPLLAHEQVRDR